MTNSARFQAPTLSSLCRAALAAAILGLAALPGRAATVQDLGALGTAPDGRGYSLGVGVNAAGQVSGWSDAYDADHKYLGERPFRYSGGTMQDLGTLGTDADGYNYSQAAGINASGQVAGFSQVYDAGHRFLGVRAFLYSGGTMQDLSTLGGTNPFGYSTSEGFGVNARGQVSGWSEAYDADHRYLGTYAFLYSKGQMQNLGSLGTDPTGVGYSLGYGINASGQVTGLSEIYDAAGMSRGRHAFLYSKGEMQDLGALGTDPTGHSYSQGYGINARGQVAGSSESFDAHHHDLGPHAFLYSGGRMQDLGTLGTDPYGYGYSQAAAVNASGQVVGVSEAFDATGTDLGPRAFLYSRGRMQDLNGLLPAGSGWVLEAALGISDAGQITGVGTINGSQHAFLLTR